MIIYDYKDWKCYEFVSFYLWTYKGNHFLTIMKGAKE